MRSHQRTTTVAHASRIMQPCSHNTMRSFCEVIRQVIRCLCSPATTPARRPSITPRRVEYSCGQGCSRTVSLAHSHSRARVHPTTAPSAGGSVGCTRSLNCCSVTCSRHSLTHTRVALSKITSACKGSNLYGARAKTHRRRKCVGAVVRAPLTASAWTGS